MKIHYTKGYKFPDNGNIHFVTYCGKYRKDRKSKVMATVLPERINCKACLKIMDKRGL